jgi:hypothetical protein
LNVYRHTPFNKNKKVIKKGRERERENGAAPCTSVVLNSDRENIEQREKSRRE